MSVHPTRTDDHLERTRDKPTVVSDVPSRQGVTGHNVRYMLLFGIGAAVVGLIGAMVFFFRWRQACGVSCYRLARCAYV
jgi:hypothetical protein